MRDVRGQGQITSQVPSGPVFVLESTGSCAHVAPSLPFFLYSLLALPLVPQGPGPAIPDSSALQRLAKSDFQSVELVCSH